MNTTRRQALWLIAGVAGGALLHACIQSSPKSTDNTLSASMGLLTWVGLTPLYIAVEKGFFKQQGLNLDIKIFSANADSNAAFAAGRLHGIAPVTSEAVLIAAQGKDFRIIMIQDISLGADGILARKSIADIKNLKGKRIGVDKGSVSHFFLLQVLSEAGLSEKDVTLVAMTPEAAAAAYQTGKIEAAVTYSPFLEQANAEQKDGRVIYDSAKMPGAIADLFAFDTKFLEANPQAGYAFVSGVLKGLDFLNKNRSEGLAIAAQRLNIKPEELDKNLKLLKLPDLPSNLDMLTNPQSQLYLGKYLQEIGKFLLSQKQISKLPDLSKLIEPKYLKAVSDSGIR